LSRQKNTKQPSLSQKKPAQKAPKPTATGDDRIAILKHGIYRKGEETLGIELTIKNILDTIIGTALFEAVFYDKKGNTLDTIEYKTVELRPDMGRTLCITSSKPERSKIESYAVKLVKTITPPTPKATGSDKLAIINHKLYLTDMSMRGPMGSDGAKLVVKNVSDEIIASAVFDVIFYDIEGNIVYRFEHKETDIKPGNSRSIIIFPPERTRNVLKSYDIKVIRVMTADEERVQVRRHEARTTETGEEEFRGTVKNISNNKADAVLVATFYDDKKEIIGTKAIILRDIEPDSIKQFHFRFRPQAGDIVRTYNLRVVCDIEE
jgi:hypothetical protein